MCVCVCVCEGERGEQEGAYRFRKLCLIPFEGKKWEFNLKDISCGRISLQLLLKSCLSNKISASAL